VAALEDPLAPAHTPVDAYGAFDDRASWLACARRRAGRSTRIAFRDLRARFIGGVAIVTGVNGVEGLGDLQAGARPDLA
jgi:hypothetical protein